MEMSAESSYTRIPVYDVTLHENGFQGVAAVARNQTKAHK